MTATALPVLADAYDHPDVRAVPGAARDAAAQITLTTMRREQHPELTTWSPYDQTEPTPPPTTVIDGDGDTWTRNARSRRWRMTGYSAARYESDAGRAWFWRSLTRKYGPLTTPEPTDA